jgi:uncharacterized OB-fold protein
VTPVTTLLTPTRIAFTIPASLVTTRFLDGIVEGRFVGRRCPDCAKVYVPPRGACPTCGVPLGDEVGVGPGGVVTAYCVVHIPFEGQLLTPPYACAHVLLDGADVPLLHLVGNCPPDAVRDGLRVEPVWSETPTRTLLSLRYFQPMSP